MLYHYKVTVNVISADVHSMKHFEVEYISASAFFY